ncbi:MAG: toll/interleukin-1 receptor domain-containing protein, partial [Alphaproteobacteria bacterium]|nr:toll/interleukin-1 receptor domain-containing protein [Alphaproteobacteria bacterium]
MADVFISYKSERRAAAEHLAEILADYGFTVWWDYALVSGKDFGAEIERELRTAKAVVVLWCGLSRDSEWVKEEAALAKRLDKIVPARIEDIDLPLGFSITQTLDLSAWDGAPQSDHLERLLRDVARLVGRAAVPNEEGLQRTERAWHRFGAPPLTGFALIDPLERERTARTLPDALLRRQHYETRPPRAIERQWIAGAAAVLIAVAGIVLGMTFSSTPLPANNALADGVTILAPQQTTAFQPLPGEPNSIAYRNLETNVTGHISRNAGARWTEYNDEMTTGRPWTQIAPKDTASTNIELIDGDVTLVIDLS